jgi:hypothetical protein
MKELLELVRALAWPIVTLAALAAFHEPLVEFVKDLGKRATKISAFHVEIEFPALAEAHVSSFTAKIQEMNQSAMFTSSSNDLENQLRSLGPMDYAVIDLGDGKRWLTSRLFLFAILLERMRGLRCLVFVATVGGDPRRFIGLASPARLRWALARNCPWLEQAFASAYQGVLTGIVPNQQLILSASGALDPSIASSIIAGFLGPIQTPFAQPGWIPLSGNAYWEHADWIDTANVDSFLGNVLQRSMLTGSADRSKEEIVNTILRSKGDFVASLEPSGRFMELIDRRAILEQLAERQ